MSQAQLLKDAILQAAIQGKLTEQLDTDSSVDELLTKIFQEKQKTTKSSKQTAAAQITDDSLPYDIPESWRWVRFGNLVNFSMGKTPPRGEPLYWKNDFPWVSISDMPENGVIKSTSEKVSLYAFENTFGNRYSPAGTLLMSFKLTVGRVAYLGIDAVHNEAIISIFPICDTQNIIKKYLFKVLPFISQYGDTKAAIKGKTLNKTSISNLLIPLPPIEEQKRIVERVDELLVKVDEFEKIEIQLTNLKQNFPSDLRSAILQAAMQGKLTEQLDTDSSVDELVKELKQNKISLSDKDKKKKKALDIVYFDIPDTWRWVKLTDCGATNIGLTYSPTDISLTEGTIVLRSSNIKNGKLDYGDTVRVNMTITDNKMCHIGDILICARNGSRKLVGKTAIIDKEGMAFGAFMAIYRSKCNPYINYVLQSPHFKKSVLGDAETTTINQITQDMLENYIFPLPPIEEQQRIVEKLDKLIPLCDELNI